MLKRILQIVAVLGSGLYLYNKIPDPNVPSTPPKTVPKVDVTKYAGTWYEIALNSDVLPAGLRQHQGSIQPQP
jgi:lipocalin